MWRRIRLVALSLALCSALVRPVTAAPDPPPEQVQQQLFDAVRDQLRAANLPAQDLPKQIIEAKTVGEKRYEVHMAMGVGDAWFLVWWEGGRWHVQGMNPPE